MKLSENQIIALVCGFGVGISGLAFAVLKPQREPTPRFGVLDSGVVASPIVRWLDTTVGSGALLAISRHMDSKFGYPLLSYYQDGAVAPYATLHQTLPIPHCATQGRYALPMFANTAVEWAILKANCVNQVEAGATGPCVEIAATPALSTSLDSSWTYDGGTCWWDASAPAPLPNDDFDGGTP